MAVTCEINTDQELFEITSPTFSGPPFTFFAKADWAKGGGAPCLFMLAVGASSNDYWEISRQSGLVSRQRDGGVDDISKGSGPVGGDVSFVWTVDASLNVNVYEDGTTNVLSSSGPHANSPDGTPDIIGFGGNVDSTFSNCMHGEGEYFAAWNRVLHINEIESLMHGCHPKSIIGCQHLVRLLDLTDTTDLIGNSPVNVQGSPTDPGEQINQGAIEFFAAPNVPHVDGASGVNLTVPLGTFTVTGNAPTQAGGGGQATVPLGSFTFTGLPPTQTGGGGGVAVPLGTFLFTDLPPTQTGGGGGVIVPLGVFTLTGLPPTEVGSGTIVVVPLGTFTFTGLAPAQTGGGGGATVPLGTFTLTGIAPTDVGVVTVNVDVPLGTFTFTGLTPTQAGGGGGVTAPLRAFTLTGFAPTMAGPLVPSEGEMGMSITLSLGMRLG